MGAEVEIIQRHVAYTKWKNTAKPEPGWGKPHHLGQPSGERTRGTVTGAIFVATSVEHIDSLVGE